jgi:hypothetical protein
VTLGMGGWSSYRLWHLARLELGRLGLDGPTLSGALASTNKCLAQMAYAPNPVAK